MKTIITHFYNEEYLLPRWLKHHRQYFDYGILIDYHSTDRSREICKEICPDWTVVTSRNHEFDAIECDAEVLDYEKELPGWKISLTTTEFLVGDVAGLMSEDLPEPTSRWSDDNSREYFIRVNAFYAWNPKGTLDPDLPLWNQLKFGVDCYAHHWHFRSRVLYNHKFMTYDTHGRHFSTANTNYAYVFKYSNAIASPEMLKRRLQIQDRVSERDLKEHRGWHHCKQRDEDTDRNFTEEKLFRQLLNGNHLITDCTTIIKHALWPGRNSPDENFLWPTPWVGTTTPVDLS